MFWRLSALLIVLFVAGAGAALLVRAFSDPPTGPLGEYRTPQEDIMLPRLMATGIKIVNANATHGVYHRDAHPKTHGCVLASFTVNPPKWPLNQGPFSNAGTYKAWIRFSSGNPEIQSDWKPDARGMAIKILGMNSGGLDQDFVMINNPVFMLRNIEEYAEFSAYQAAATAQHDSGLMFTYFRLRPDNRVTANPFQWRSREFLLGLQILKWPPVSLLKTQYHSMTAYRLGSAGYLKFSARPVACSAAETVSAWSFVSPFDANALGADLKRRVGEGPRYCFDFLIQPQRLDKNMPVEDATVLWKESDSPFIPVGRIEIGKSEIAASPDRGFCENLSFSPWRGYPEFEPAGGLNRVRKAVYASVSQYRHCLNGADVGEPLPDGKPEFVKKACVVDSHP